VTPVDTDWRGRPRPGPWYGAYYQDWNERHPGAWVRGELVPGSFYRGDLWGSSTLRSIDKSLQFMLTDRMTWCSFNASLDPGQRRSVKRTGQSRCSGVLFEYFASSAVSAIIFGTTDGRKARDHGHLDRSEFKSVAAVMAGAVNAVGAEVSREVAVMVDEVISPL
jgi:hypothetical protein